jgi:hypothetical protein
MLGWISFIIGIIGTFVSVFGVAYALYERRQRVSLEHKMQSQQWAMLDRARYVIGDHILFEEFDKEITHRKNIFCGIFNKQHAIFI